MIKNQWKMTTSGRCHIQIIQWSPNLNKSLSIKYVIKKRLQNNLKIGWKPNLSYSKTITQILNRPETQGNPGRTSWKIMITSERLTWQSKLSSTKTKIKNWISTMRCGKPRWRKMLRKLRRLRKRLMAMTSRATARALKSCRKKIWMPSIVRVHLR